MVTIAPTPSSGTFGAFRSPVPQKKSLLPYLAVILGAVLILASGYYLFIYQEIGLSLTTPIIPAALPLTPLETKVAQLPRFSFEVFEGSFYRSLKSYGTLPIVADSLGRVNPFIPY